MAGAVTLAPALTGRVERVAVTLPQLRPDLHLLPGPATPDGAPSWTIHDPSRHRFFRIGWAEFEYLTRWDLGDPASIAAAVAAQTTLRARTADVQDLAAFLQHAGLTVPRGPAGLADMLAEQNRGRLSAGSWLLKNYLFLRLRLLNPDAALAALVPLTNWMFTRRFVGAMVGLALLALYLIGRQWDGFTHSLQEMFTLEGALMVAVALSAAKMVHEFGHGIAARHYGCKVPAMGVALDRVLRSALPAALLLTSAVRGL